MFKALTVSQIQALEETAIKTIGIPLAGFQVKIFRLFEVLNG